MIASTLTVFGAGIAAAWKFAGPAAHADGVSAALDAPARALAPAARIPLPNRLSFPVRLPGDIVVLNNFGTPIDPFPLLPLPLPGVAVT